MRPSSGRAACRTPNTPTARSRSVPCSRTLTSVTRWHRMFAKSPIACGRSPREARRARSYSRPASRATVIRVSPWTAQRLGAIVGAALAIVGVIWVRTRATPCPGAVTLEFHPPLADPGSYQIQLSWQGIKPCTLTVHLPLDPKQRSGEKTGCGMALQLRTQVQDERASIAGLTFAASPARFRLHIKRDSEPIYDT